MELQKMLVELRSDFSNIIDYKIKTENNCISDTGHKQLENEIKYNL